VFTEPFPSNDRKNTIYRIFAWKRWEGYTYRNIDCWEAFMKYAVEMDSGAMTYIPCFIKIGSGIQKLMEEDSQTCRQHGDRISILSYFQNKESRLTMQLLLLIAVKVR
jgi:hypothetical protein